MHVELGSIIISSVTFQHEGCLNTRDCSDSELSEGFTASNEHISRFFCGAKILLII